ncbi:tetratricopeptide repeat protein [Edaphobacter sp. 12200R-103]|uniref:tetratricopeptide repeat protein n=1 Tax=Edaphobacter sp. 12200R-103 TaxID=2703788 RepID=UPI00138CD9F5|nr:tetratricopeptide repeat protein [Edaphobacter sp. 12200R-103]QHS50675.1 tetratricopeptide repeat protein [Edaphobacter sp. 12200R-103]
MQSIIPHYRAHRWQRFLPLMALAAGLCPILAHAQLPAGTRDVTEAPQQDPLRAQAADALSRQDYATAAKLLSTLAEKNPKDAQVLYNLGSAQDALNQPTEAEASYRKAIDAGPNLLEPHLALGLLLARSGKAQQAHAELAAAAAIPNGDAALRGRAYRAMARLDQASNPSGASEELLAALKLTPETPEDTLLAGELAEANGDPVGAETAFRRLLASNPNDPDATAALVHLLIAQKKPDQAEPLLISALAKNPDDPTLTAQLASLYEMENKPDKAVPLVETLHAAHPQDPAISRLLARLYVRNSQYEKALPLYVALSAASPNDPTLLDDQADTLIRMHRAADAEPLLKRAIADPKAFPTPETYGVAASHLAFAAANNNDPATVLQALELRAKVLPPSTSTLFLAATAHDKLHQVKEASDLYKQFLAAAKGQFPDEEWEAKHRLAALEHMR